MAYDYDLFVIGAGSGGLAASKRAASYGAKVAIAEGDLVGGTCVIRGCVPKKLMVYASKFSHLYEDAVGYGWSKVEPSFDWQKLVTAVNNEVMRLNQLHINFLAKAGVELFQSRATLVDSHTVEVNGRKITADKILIAVGGEAIKPDLPGVEYTVTSREMFHLKEQPKRLLVIGAGYIAVEFACIMHGLGSQVSVMIRGDRILKDFDEDISSGVKDGMSKHGIDFICNSLAKKFEQTSEGIKITYAEKGKDTESTITADAVLFAIGRAPNLARLGLETADVEVINCEDEDLPRLHGYSVNCAIQVDEYSRTNQPNIFAVGDCTNRINLTPVAIGEGRAFADTEFGNNPRVFSHHEVASAVFSQPEAGTVGLSEAEARQKYGDAVKIYRARFRPMFHSLTGADEKVTVKLVVDSNTERVLGAHMVGENAAEIIQGIAIAVKMGATKKDFDATVGIHPSTAEEFVTLR
ncbi:glutathione-disulfide reductase [Aerosakkonema funiforme]|uniref:Glutathione reductase n=2 Tax=Oscillatoriophycideae TaxID=1301283 RepID=A0A926VBS3_9CYAN|nr:glutathione-disulfide reductase [Aerosakkonema funiforme]MBD2180775.1 glutathione-disulfide reductase [Aerosakkonema funiforme FACHB-1375]